MTYSVYKHFDAEGLPLYIGYSRNVTARQEAHKGKEWWPLSTTMEVIECHKKALAKEYERREIHRLRPRFNRQYNPDYGNWTPPSKPRADCPNETDKALWIMQNTPLLAWPAEYRADYCRIMKHNWKRRGLTGVESREQSDG